MNKKLLHRNNTQITTVHNVEYSWVKWQWIAMICLTLLYFFPRISVKAIDWQFQFESNYGL